MRIAFISDIHGNYPALQAVLKDCESQKVERFVCLGDTITMGPQPLEVLAAIRKLNALYIKGNHDFAVLNPEKAEQYEITHYLIPDLEWCHDQLSPDDRAFIASFQPLINIPLLNGLSILAFHGSPLCPTDIIQATTPPELLDKYFEGQSADIFIGGHSHIQLVRRHGGKLVLNSGSVGNAFKFTYSPGNPPSLLPWAEYMIIEQADNALGVHPRRVYFDVNEVHQAARESNMPGRAWWLQQYGK